MPRFDRRNPYNRNRRFSRPILRAFEIRINPPEKTRAPAIRIAFDDSHGTRIFTAGTYFSTTYIDEIEGPTIVRCVIDGAQLAPGNYKLTLSAGSQRNWLVDVLDGAVSLQIDQDDYFGNGAYPKPMHGLAWQRSSWTVLPGA